MYYPEHSHVFKEALDFMKGKQVVVLSHSRPDGDSIGSQMALCRVLNAVNIEANSVYFDPAPEPLTPFIDNTPMISYQDFSPKKDDTLVINVDCADEIRTGKPLREIFPSTFMNIDHHISNTQYGKYNIIDNKATATAEILTQLFLDNKLPIDAIAAQGLYVGIATDTGQFKYPTTSAKVFRLCAELLNLGANPGEASYHLYECKPIEEIRLLQEFLGTVKTELAGKICIGIIRKAVYERTGTTREHIEGFVNYTRSIKGVELGVLLEEIDEGIKGSLRANSSKLRVDLLAKFFQGGGHAAAAGFKVLQPLDQFYPEFFKTVEKHFKEYRA